MNFEHRISTLMEKKKKQPSCLVGNGSQSKVRWVWPLTWHQAHVTSPRGSLCCYRQWEGTCGPLPTFWSTLGLYQGFASAEW